MSAVFDEVKGKAMREQNRGFTTMHGESGNSATESLPENTSSTVGQYVGSAFLTGAVVIYALHGEPYEMGDRAKVLRVFGAHVFPLIGHTHTSTMSAGGPWVASEREVYSSGVVRLPWARKVVYSGKVQVKTAALSRRPLRTIVGDFVSDEGNG